MEALIDPSVSKVKFDREIALYKELEREYCSRGWFLVKAEFPEVFVVFGSNKTNPPALVIGVLLDFLNYDLVPPSVRFVHPFTRIPYKHNELPTKLKRNVGTTSTRMGEAIQIQELIQPGFTPEALPFLCLPGVREYHDNPAHTADSWLQRRGKGEGTLVFLLEQISKYGIDPIKGYEFQIGITGIKLSQNTPPT